MVNFMNRPVRLASLSLMSTLILVGCAASTTPDNLTRSSRPEPVSSDVHTDVSRPHDRAARGEQQRNFQALKNRSVALIRGHVDGQHDMHVPASGDLVLSNTVSHITINEVLWGHAPRSLSIVQSGSRSDTRLQFAEFLEPGKEYVFYVTRAPAPEYAGLHLISGDDTAYMVRGQMLERSEPAPHGVSPTPHGRGPREGDPTLLPQTIPIGDAARVMLGETLPPHTPVTPSST